MSTKSKGTAREHKVRQRLLAEGWVVYRGAASLGAADLICLHHEHRPMLVQVKANRAGGAWMNFRGVERATLALEALAAGADAWLVHYPPGGSETWYAKGDWPARKDQLKATITGGL